MRSTPSTSTVRSTSPSGRGAGPDRPGARPGRLAPQLDARGAGAGAVRASAGARPGRIRPQPVTGAGRRWRPAGLLHRLIRQTCDQPILLMGNSMAASPPSPRRRCTRARRRLVLVDAVLPGPCASGAPERSSSPSPPTSCHRSSQPAPARPGSRFRRRPVKGALRLNAEHFERIPPDVVEAHVQLERTRGRIPDNDVPTSSRPLHRPRPRPPGMLRGLSTGFGSRP